MQINDIQPLPCLPLQSFKKQIVINSNTVLQIDNENAIGLFLNVLQPDEIEEYLMEAIKVPRVTGKSGFGIKPRKEICYTVDGNPYIYSKIIHPTLKYPEHVLKVIKKFLVVIDKKFDHIQNNSNPYTILSNGVDILYDSSFPRGGSISAHKDDEDKWGLIMIYSLGQTRYLRVRNDNTKQYYNIKMEHNSLTVMYGESFQKYYSHQVDKLSNQDVIGARLSLNVRFKKQD